MIDGVYLDLIVERREVCSRREAAESVSKALYRVERDSTEVWVR